MGTILTPSYWAVPTLPDIISEWAGIIPLVAHLADRRYAHQSVGQAALLGRLFLGLFPKLGVYSELAKLLRTGLAFLDDASSKGASSMVVWDVLWGGSFPCANGAASSAIVEYALSRQKMPPEKMPDRVEDPPSRKSSYTKTDEKAEAGSPSKSSDNMAFRRFQTLHELRFNRKPIVTSWATRLDNALCSRAGESATFLAILVLSIILAILGLYGSAALIASNAVTQLACAFHKIMRPYGYLDSNEGPQECCMLVANHSNVRTWYLFTGDRGVVDTLLNKTMIDLPDTRYGKFLAHMLSVAHTTQLLGMTYVAGQKGWDGVCLVILLFASRLARYPYRNERLAQMWLEREGIEVNARSYQFTGRMMMLGAIQKLSGSRVTEWMDSIVTAHPRREAWLAYLLHGRLPDSDEWSAHDLNSITLSARLAEAAAEAIRRRWSTSAGA